MARQTGDPEHRHQSDLYTRPGWVDATVALDQLDQGKAKGDRGALWIRCRIQHQLRDLGTFIDTHAGKVLFVNILVIATFCVGLKSTTFHTNIEQLWATGNTRMDASPMLGEVLSTHQMVLQTAVDPDASLLHPRALMEHLSLVKQATQVTVTLFDNTWSLKDLCHRPSIPIFEMPYHIENMFEIMIPCSIITPLDCFWEGSKLLGPDIIPKGIGSNITWTNLNPTELINRIKTNETTFDFYSLEDYLRRAGITTGYQEKPCLDPKDPECPITSNKNSSQVPDIGAELTSGCYGVAAKYMHWPEELIVGGTTKNKTGHIRQAKALQTVVQLFGEHELYNFFSGDYKVHHIGWSLEKAALILNTWQQRFSEEVKRLTTQNITSPSYNFNTFSTATLNNILTEHQKIDVVKFGIVLGVILVYVWLIESGLAAFGVILLVSSTAAGLGVCSLLGFPMNILTTHVLPFLSVGLAIRNVLLLLATYNRSQATNKVLQRSGSTVIATALTNAAAFGAASLIPVPALRTFCLQCAVLIVFNTLALLLAFPALIALKIRCKKASFTCLSPHKAQTLNNNAEHSKNLLNAELICQQKNTSLMRAFIQHLTSIILKPFVKFTLCFTYGSLIIFCAFNALKVEYNVNMSTFLPKDTQEYRYLELQNKFFGFYNFYLVTTELEYPLNQDLLYEYHASLTKVPHILKDSNGGLNLNNFWLSNFRDFLLDLQAEFDQSLSSNCLNNEKWFPNATEKAVLAFKLLSQTGIVEFPVDKSQILKKRLVNNGIIDPKSFYNYLSVWNTIDLMSYTSSQANLTPKPFAYESSKTEIDLKIPKSQPLVSTQMPFYLKNLKSTSKIIETLKQIHALSATYNNKGLKNYPIGLIFAYFDQFLYLDYLLAIQAILTILATGFVTCCLIKWTKIWCGIVNVLLSMCVLCLVNINAMSGVMAALHWSLVFRNVVLILTGFISSIGSKERRITMSLELNSGPIIKGEIALLLCIIVLGFSDFEFIQMRLFYILVMSIATTLFNAVIFFPLMLTLMGPQAEVVPLEHTDRISTPPPPTPAPIRTPSYPKAPRRSNGSKTTREPSLTTISEEESYNQSIVVQPEITVKYSSPESSSSGAYTTKVTTNIKVEVVAPGFRNSSTKCSSTSNNEHNNQCEHTVFTECNEKQKCCRRSCRECSQRRNCQCSRHSECCRLSNCRGDSENSDNSAENGETERQWKKHEDHS